MTGEVWGFYVSLIAIIIIKKINGEKCNTFIRKINGTVVFSLWTGRPGVLQSKQLQRFRHD